MILLNNSNQTYLRTTIVTVVAAVECCRILKDVCSQSPTDYGKTALIEYRIDTGEARPVRQAPRRTPRILREQPS